MLYPVIGYPRQSGGQPAYPTQPSYPTQGYPVQTGYPQQVAYPQQGGYPQQGVYPPQSYQQPLNNPQHVQPYPNMIPQGPYSQPGYAGPPPPYPGTMPNASPQVMMHLHMY